MKFEEKSEPAKSERENFIEIGGKMKAKFTEVYGVKEAEKVLQELTAVKVPSDITFLYESSSASDLNVTFEQFAREGLVAKHLNEPLVLSALVQAIIKYHSAALELEE